MIGPSTISSSQCQTARALLGWSQAKLSALADVPRAAIARFESGDALDVVEIIALKRVLEAADIEFTTGADGSLGVRLASDRDGGDGSRDLA